MAEADGEAVVEGPGDRGGGDLEDELGLGGEAYAVVHDAQRYENAERREEAESLLAGLLAERRVDAREQEQQGGERDEDGEAAAARDGVRVDVAGEVRLVHHAPLREEPEQESRQEKRDNARGHSQKEHHPNHL